jgi:hypothetical protein
LAVQGGPLRWAIHVRSGNMCVAATVLGMICWWRPTPHLMRTSPCPAALLSTHVHIRGNKTHLVRAT